jgi:hypothetical protein
LISRAKRLGFGLLAMAGDAASADHRARVLMIISF